LNFINLANNFSNSNFSSARTCNLNLNSSF